MTLCLLLAALALPARAALLDDSRLVAALAAVEKAGGKHEAEQFRERIGLAEKGAKVIHGCVVAGKLTLEGPGDADAVGAQMRVFPGGYFADAYDPKGAPLGFRAPGYLPLDIGPECKDGLAWVEASMTPAPDDERGAMKAKLEVPGGEVKAARISVYPALAPTNSDGAGVDAREACRKGERCPSIPAPKVEIGDGGALKASGLSPVVHDLWVTAPGYVSASSTFSVTPGKTTDLGVVALERAKRLTLRWLATETLPFSGEARVSSATAAEPWASRAGGKRWWHEVLFDQKDGRLTIMPATGPADIADLGAGTVEEFAGKVREKSLDPKTPYRLPLIDGHAYLIRERYFGRWLLLTVAIEP